MNVMYECDRLFYSFHIYKFYMPFWNRNILGLSSNCPQLRARANVRTRLLMVKSSTTCTEKNSWKLYTDNNKQSCRLVAELSDQSGGKFGRWREICTRFFGPLLFFIQPFLTYAAEQSASWQFLLTYRLLWLTCTWQLSCQKITLC